MMTHKVKGLHIYRGTGKIDAPFYEKDVAARENRQEGLPKTMLCAVANWL